MTPEELAVEPAVEWVDPGEAAAAFLAQDKTLSLLLFQPASEGPPLGLAFLDREGRSHWTDFRRDGMQHGNA